MLTEAEVKGIYIPVVTPFKADEELDRESYVQYLEHLLAQPIQGLVVNGTTGEAPTVVWDEVEELVRLTQDTMNRLNRRLPLVVGTGTNSTASTVRQTEWAGQLGVDAVLITAPYYNRPSAEGVIGHYRRAAEVGVPVIAYENPGRTGNRLAVDTVRSVLELDGVIGLKDSSGGVGLIAELARTGSKPVLCGDDALFYAMLCHGATGGILATANVRTASFAEVSELGTSGDLAGARRAFEPLVPMIRKLMQESNPAPLKWVLAEQGHMASDTLRAPMTTISEELKRELRDMAEIGWKEIELI